MARSLLFTDSLHILPRHLHLLPRHLHLPVLGMCVLVLADRWLPGLGRSNPKAGLDKAFWPVRLRVAG